jgi:glycosyltransferase involved in cell wall biosynthesis
MKLGINAARARSGGAKTHLIGILSASRPLSHGIKEVHVWSYPELLAALPDEPWLIKHLSPAASGPMICQIYWERFELPRALMATGCNLLFNVDAGSVCRFRPAVTMSRDMLSYEPGEIHRYGFSKARIRLFSLRYVQNSALRFADGVIFLTEYAARVIQQSSGQLRQVCLIPHGVSRGFQEIIRISPWPINGERPVKLLYVSNTDWYKHQWMVVRAVELLRMRKIDVTLTLVGGGTGPAQQRLTEQIAVSDPRGEFVTQLDFVPQADLPAHLAEADIFVFASSCENLPNTLVEAMAAGLPIACARRGPMPEVLEDGGEYFDPEIPESIADAIQKLVEDPDLRRRVSLRAKGLASRYSWERCGMETWSFLAKIYTRTVS